MKIKFSILCILCGISVLSFADRDIKPVINGKTYHSFQMNQKNLPKPSRVIKGAVDECNNSYFPDENDYGRYTVTTTGRIKTVYLQNNNAIILYGEKLTGTTTKSSFQKKFKNQILDMEIHSNKFSVFSMDDEYKSVQLFFKNNHLAYYRLWVNDC